MEFLELTISLGEVKERYGLIRPRHPGVISFEPYHAYVHMAL